jgi:hypothetical protein
MSQKVVLCLIMGMDLDFDYFKNKKEKAKVLYDSKREIWCPYFQTKVVLNSDGFHHLQFSSRREREKRAQLLKFSLLPFAFEIINRSGTMQEYRSGLRPIGKSSTRDGSVVMKQVEYWGFVAILGENKVKVRVVLRRVGAGNIIFWSVMPDIKFKNGKQKLAPEMMEDE